MALMRKGKKGGEEQFLDIDASMQGSLVFNEPLNLKIQGKFEGKLDTKGILVIGDKAEVNADIVGDTIIISGKVSGTVTASRELKLLYPSVVNGELRTSLLIIEKGSILNGNCKMSQQEASKSAVTREVMGIDEVSKYLSVDVASLAGWAEQGKIPAFKEANTWKFEKVKIDEWIAAGKLH
jgi:cytoskeletal protein CcmA (bactofilin family)